MGCDGIGRFIAADAMNPGHCPPFFVPDQNQNSVKSQATRSIPHAKYALITGLFGPVLAEFNQPTGTTIALQESHHNARLVSIQPFRCSFAIH
jgi:hypothetical protein